MEPSPLTQQARPETFQPKIVKLYELLFKDDEDYEKPEGFWTEFFLLKPEKGRLQDILGSLHAEDLLHLQLQTRQLFARCVVELRNGQEPSDVNALDTLTAFLGSSLAKRYTNPSSDIIAVLTGLDRIDATFAEFVSALETAIRNGRALEVRKKAVEVALCTTAGAYQTSLLSYFTHRDLFPALMKYIQDVEDDSYAFNPFLLLGLLANYNKFEFQNPYRARLDDFVNETTIQKIVKSIGTACCFMRDKYVSIQDDSPESWTLGSTLTFFSFGAFGSGVKSTSIAPEEAKALFATLPSVESAVLLATYDFTNANKIFCFNLLNLTSDNKGAEAPFGAFLSLTSYLVQHAHRSARSSMYTYLTLIILRILLEDPVFCRRTFSDESKTVVRLCRQRQPYLPLVHSERPTAAAIVDIVVNGINHNLRRRLDVHLYLLYMNVLLRVVSFLGRSRTRFGYHWSELWRSLLSLIRFLTTYASDLKTLPDIYDMLDVLVNVIALSLSTGDAFLPGTSDYDDLFYKLVETGDILVKFRDAYSLATRPSNSIGTLISVSEHYHSLLESSKGKSPSRHLSPREVSRVIKTGYETLSIQAKEGLDSWDKYREADERTFVKRMARVAVDDVKKLLSER